MDPTNETLERHWKLYLAAYAAGLKEERDRLLAQCVTEGVIFTNPGGEGKSRAGLSAHIERFHSQMPGAYFTTDRTYVHHGEMLAVWSMHKPDGAKVATGYNFVRPAQDGRFEYLAGFF